MSDGLLVYPNEIMLQLLAVGGVLTTRNRRERHGKQAFLFISQTLISIRKTSLVLCHVLLIQLLDRWWC